MRNLSFSSVLSDPDTEKINDPKKLTLQALTVSHAQNVTPLCAKQDRRKVSESGGSSKGQLISE